MTDKPTYEELEKRILELERAETVQKKTRPNPDESEDIYRRLIDFSPLPFLVTQDEKIVFANPAALVLFGTTDQGEIIGTGPRDWIHPDFVERSYRRRCRIIANGGSVNPMEMILLRHDKKEAVVIANATRISYHGSPALLTIFHDITDRKRAEEELRLSESRFRNAFEHSAIGMALVSPEGKWIKVNRRVCDIVGYTETELMRKTFQDITHPEDLNADLGFVRRMLAGEIETYQMEKRYFHKDGRIVWVLLAVSLVWDDQGVPLHFISQIEDITERKRAEGALLESHEKTKLFAYSVSHDLKSPSTAIYGLAKRLQDRCADTLDDKIKTYCDKILGAAEHISTLVRQINDYISASQVALNIERFKLRDILQAVKEEFAEQLGIRRIKWSEPEHLPELSADRIAVQRVLRNLIDNALKYGGDDFNELRIGYEDTGAYHIVSVSNNGAMIREEHIRTIFGPFQRYQTARGVDGSGLGLAIVRDLAEKHGGKAWVESEREGMTTFHMSISKNL